MTPNQPAIEPVTDEDVLVAVNLPARALEPHTRRILEQDRRRVAERQAARTAEMAAWVGIAAEIERLRAEVARLTAACAAKEGWIDATGAVEATCFSHCEVVGRAPFETYRDVGRVEVPKKWAGSRVLIVRVAK